MRKVEIRAGKTVHVNNGDTCTCTIRAMAPADLLAVRQLVESTEGLAFKPWETDPVLGRLLERCDGLSQVAVDATGQVIGSVYIGEGLMAFVHHLAVKPEARGCGIATKLVQGGLTALYRKPNAARRVYITVLSTNEVAQSFWTNFGASQQAQGCLALFTLDLGEQPWLKSESAPGIDSGDEAEQSSQ